MEQAAIKNTGIRCDRLSFSWQKQPADNEYIFRNVSFSVFRGEFISFIGPSGCGKSTLLHIICGLLQSTGGTVLKDDVAVSAPDKDFGFVFQDYSLFPWLTVRGNIAFGLKLNGSAKDETEHATEMVLKKVGLWDARNKYPFQLSGGMKQRTAIARVLASKASYLLMDEPFGALDYQTRLHMQQFLAQVCKEFNKTVLFVTHHVEEAIMLSDRVFLMSAQQEKSMDELVIDLPALRDMTDPAFNEYRKHIINHLNKEVKLYS